MIFLFPQLLSYQQKYFTDMKGIKNLFKVMNDPNKLCTYSGVIQLILNRLSNKLNTH